MDLWADDVIRGYRYEAETDGTVAFRSLVAGSAPTPTTPARGGVGRCCARCLPPDEGYVKGSSTTSVPGDEDLYLHEAIASWSGWSMVAPRPGAGVTEDELPDEGQSPLERDPDASRHGPSAGDVASGAAPGSLPTLRFGSSYRLRARTVDLAAQQCRPPR